MLVVMIHGRTKSQASFTVMRNMQNNQYNGYANRETWMLKLWIDNDRESYFYWRKIAVELQSKQKAEEAKESLAECLQQMIQEDAPDIKHGMYAELLSTAIAHVEWIEIAEAMLSDIDARQPESPNDEFGPVHAYTRANAIADGVLVDVSKLAGEAGFQYPVAMTSAAWADCVSVPDGANDQDETGRLWDVLNVLLFSIKCSGQKNRSSEIRFKVSVRNGEETSEDIELKSVCGPGDEAEPVITIMLTTED